MRDWRADVAERLRGVKLPPEREVEVLDEVAQHLEDRFQELRRDGATYESAVAGALDELEDLPVLRRRLDALRVPRPGPRAAGAEAGRWVVGFWHDLRAAGRALRHTRNFALLAIGVLAACGGLNLAVFAIVNALWLRPVPVPNADRVVALIPYSTSNLTTPTLSTFEDAAGQVATNMNLEPELRFRDTSRALEVMGVTANYFRLFGLEIRGRDFTDDDDREGAELVAIISDRLWSQSFGRRMDILGSTQEADPAPVRIIGVAPAGFEGAQRGERTDVWIPRSVFARVLRVQPGVVSAEDLVGFSTESGVGVVGAPAQQPLRLSMNIWARLAPGDSVAAAEQRVRAGATVRQSVALVPLSDVYGTPTTRTTVVSDDGAARVVAGLALLVLLGGCAALASLLLVHYERRRLEFAVRSALGASASRMVQFVACELGIIAMAGIAGALAVAHIVLRGVGALNLHLPAGMDLARLNLSFDWRVLAVGVAITIVPLVFAGSVPVFRLIRKRVAHDLMGGPATTASVMSQRLRQSLLSLLVAATAVVLVSAALFVRAVDRAFGPTVGFDVDHTLFVAVPLTPPQTFRSYDFQYERMKLVREALRAVPGIDVVAQGLPPVSDSAATQVRAPRPFNTGGAVRQLRIGGMPGSYDALAALGVPIVAGRGLTAADYEVRPRPTVVTESAARTLWPTENPLGQRMGGNEYVIVGVARDFAFGSLAAPADGVLVRPLEDRGARAHFILRTARTDASLISEVRGVLADVLRDTPTATVLTGRDVVARDVGRQRLGAWFFSAFGLVALLVGVGSVFGMVAYLAESRRREFGVRLALGAAPGDLVWLGVATALVPVGVGLVVGLAMAAIVSQVFGSLLVGVSPVDVQAYAVVAIVLAGSAAVAAVAAAWRLRSVAPAEALRVS